MGLFDLPAPLFSIPTALLSGLLPPVVLIVLWGVVGGVVGVELYRLLSPQQRLTILKTDLRSAQERLSGYDGDLAGAWPLMGRLLRLAFGRFALVLPAAILSSLPVLALIVWLDTVYSRSLPSAGQPVAATTSSADFEAHWTSASSNEVPHIVVTDRAGQTVADVAVRAPVDRIEKRRWWNFLFGNPLGYLPEEAAFDHVDLALPRQELIDIGPRWLRGWEPIFFAALLLCAIPFSLFRRVQ
jgi:hypothetical protein